MRTVIVDGVYQSGLSAPVGAADRPVWVLNATPGGTLIVDLPRRPAKAEVFDTFGAAKGTPSLSAGVNAVAVPPSGCLKLTWD